MLMDVPVKLFDRDVEKVKVGAGAFCFFPKENLDDAQIGYLYEKDKTESKRWVGKEFLVIGKNSVKSEPIIAKLDEPSLPIYTLINNVVFKFVHRFSSFSYFSTAARLYNNKICARSFFSYPTDKLSDKLTDEGEKM